MVKNKLRIIVVLLHICTVAKQSALLESCSRSDAGSGVVESLKKTKKTCLAKPNDSSISCLLLINKAIRSNLGAVVF